MKQDEAAAAAREAAEEQRMQEVDAERRIQILRGVKPEVIRDLSEEQAVDHKRAKPGEQTRAPKRKRIQGEDDTDRDIRIVKEIRASDLRLKTDRTVHAKRTSNEPLIDRAGHISLFPPQSSRHLRCKNAEAEAETAKKKKEYEDQFTMRFSNAAGFKQAIGKQPWYHSSSAARDDEIEQGVGTDVWGNADPRRKERQKMRIRSDDPLAAMNKGVKSLREVEKERKKLMKERQCELRELRRRSEPQT